MGSRAEGRHTKQGREGCGENGGLLGQLLLPMIDGIMASREALNSVVLETGIAVMEEFFRAEAERVVGPKGRHQADRTHHFWGSTRTEFPFGGRMVTLRRPRVRGRDGKEVSLPGVEQLRGVDCVPERVLGQILLGVSTRKYDASLERLPDGVKSRGTSKSAASRHVVRETTTRLEKFLSRRLDELDLVALMLDGLNIGDHTVVVALGIARDGTKHPLGLVSGSTENSAICTELLQGLLERSLRISRKLLCVIDGGRGIRKAVLDVFGENVLIQRCQLHKMRNVETHVAKKRQVHVRSVMSEAYRSTSAATARKRLQALVSWLDGNGEEEAAASLREGLEETLTVLKLEISATLRRSLATTNAIENLMGSVRLTTRNVKRWKNAAMARRWVSLAVASAQAKFRRIKGHKDLEALVASLQRSSASLPEEQTPQAA